jgi:hypothetical protein
MLADWLTIRVGTESVGIDGVGHRKQAGWVLKFSSIDKSPYKERQMKLRRIALISVLVFSSIAVVSTVKALDLNGSWATAASACNQVFVKKDGAISFRQDSDQYGGGFIVEGDKVRGQMQTCTITRRKEEGNVVHMVAKCADEIMMSNVQLSAKIIDANTIARVFPGMPEFTLSYSRCPM